MFSYLYQASLRSYRKYNQNIQYNKTAKADSVLLSLWILRLLYKYNEEVYVEVDDKDNFIIDENSDGEFIVTIYSNEARPQLILHKTVKPIRFKELVNNLND